MSCYFCFSSLDFFVHILIFCMLFIKHQLLSMDLYARVNEGCNMKYEGCNRKYDPIAIV